jgi:hypothetical protein
MIFAILIQVPHNVKFSMTEKEQRALGLMIESVLKPDSKLRGCAYNQDCYDELMEWRQKMLNLLYSYQNDERDHEISSQVS